MQTTVPTQLEAIPLHKGPFFTPQHVRVLEGKELPHHIAIIPDGNRRWGAQHNTSLVTAYMAAAQTLIRTALAAKELSIPVLTFYTFSTENWKRSREEIDIFMHLLDMHLSVYTPSLVEANIRIHTIGNKNSLPDFLVKTISNTSSTTEEGTKLDLVLAINYGGRNELVRAFNTLLATRPQSITEDDVSSALDTHPCQTPTFSSEQVESSGSRIFCPGKVPILKSTLNNRCGQTFHHSTSFKLSKRISIAFVVEEDLNKHTTPYDHI